MVLWIGHWAGLSTGLFIESRVDFPQQDDSRPIYLCTCRITGDRGVAACIATAAGDP